MEPPAGNFYTCLALEHCRLFKSANLRLPEGRCHQQQSPPAHQPPAAEAHPTPPTPSPAPQPTQDSLSPVVPSKPAPVAVPAPVVPVAEPQTPPGGGSTEHEEKEDKAGQEAPLANLNSAKAEAKLVKALDYLVSLSTIIPTTPAEKWFINESILASLTGCFDAGDKEIR
jgi:outer membrane biosynthesis protein TonB